MRSAIRILLMVILATSASASTWTLPFPNFVPGQTANANDVDANFANGKTAVDDNDTRITANNVRIIALEAVSTVAEIETAESIDIILATEIDTLAKLNALLTTESIADGPHAAASPFTTGASYLYPTVSKGLGNDATGSTWAIETTGAAVFLSVDTARPTGTNVSTQTFKEGAGEIGGTDDLSISSPVGGFTGARSCTITDSNTPYDGCISIGSTVDIVDLSATGTPSSTTYLRGDNTWATPAGGGDVSLIASGSAALATAAIASGACNTANTGITATGVLATDAIIWTPNADITAVTGYAPVTTGGLSIYPYPGAGVVSFKVCNPTAASITPGAVTLNWRVTR